jgi:hypothetical protein
MAVVLGNPETKTVSHFFPKLCAPLQRKRREPQRFACRSAMRRPDRAARLEPGELFRRERGDDFFEAGITAERVPMGMEFE